MFILSEKYVKHFLITFVLIQIIGFKTVQAINCVQCGTSEDCKDDLSIAATSCANDTYTKCFTQIDGNGKIIRGCHTAEEASKCTADNNCVSTGDSENNQLVCKTCSDNDCSQTDASDNKYSKICDADSTCIKKVDENKLVVRKCIKKSEAQCTEKTTCETCGTVNCNKGIFPADRLSCYHCTGDKCNDVSTSSIFAKVCALYQDKDECYTIGENEASMTRGCKSDKDANKCTASAAGCAFCNQNNCNNLKFKGQPTLKCYECSGDATNTACYGNQTEANLKPCKNEISYTQPQYCFTRFEAGKIERGCLNDNANVVADKCNDAEGGVCYKCSGDGCNSKNVAFTCIRCRSDSIPDCWNAATKVGGETCTKTSSPTDGCFHGVWNGVAIRGCMLDASEQMQAICANPNNPNKCEICHSKDCNIKKSTGAKNGLSLALMSVVLIQVTLWNFK